MPNSPEVGLSAFLENALFEHMPYVKSASEAALGSTEFKRVEQVNFVQRTSRRMLAATESGAPL